MDGVLKPIGLLLEDAGTNLISNTNSSEGWNTFGLSILVGGATIESSQFINGIERVVIRLPAGARLAFTYPNSLNGTYTASARVRVISGYEFGNFRISMAGAVDFSKAITLSETVFSTISRTDFISGTGEVNIIRRTDGGEEDVLVEVEQQQLEESSFITSYIPTQGSQVTRAADVSASPQVTRAADSCVRVLGDEFNDNEGTLYAEFSTKEVQAGIGLTDDTVLERVALRRSGAGIGQALLSSGGVTNTIDTDAGVYVDEGFNKLAVSWTLAGYKFACNGQIIGSNSLPVGRVPLFTNLIIATSQNLGIRSKVRTNKSCRLLPKALSDAELIALTGSD